jgi:putative DNA methylase
MKKAFIEYDFPVKEVSIESAKEKYIRKGNIQSMHTWWARRPLASSRATIYASLVPGPKDEKEREDRSKFITELSKWENSNNTELIEKAQRDIWDTNSGVSPKVLDPFSGGGAIPLEALRLGCKTFANDINPIAVLLEKAILEFPQKHGKPISVEQYNKHRPWMQNSINDTLNLFSKNNINPLKEDLKYWSAWIYKMMKDRLSEIYPNEKNGFIPIGYIWARTMLCPNPNCKIKIPLLKHTWLSKRKGNKIAFKLNIVNSVVKYKIYKDDDINFDPNLGTTKRANVICPNCNIGISAVETRNEFVHKRTNQQLIALVLKNPSASGKQYRIATDEDFEIYNNCETKLNRIVEQLSQGNKIYPIPDEIIKRVPFKFGVINVWAYGIDNWGKLFSKRQLLSLLITTELLNNVGNTLDENDVNNEYIKVIMTYLSFIFDKMLSFMTKNTTWKVDTTQAVNVFVGRPAIGMATDYFELNPISGGSTCWDNCSTIVLNSFQILKNIDNQAIVKQCSATNLPYENNFFDAIFTDPPYYDNVPYSYISDFYYVWLKRNLYRYYPELFSTPLTPKADEVVAYEDNENFNSGKERFDALITQSFNEMARVIKPDGIINIVYAHKSSDAWETIINAILESGLYLTGSWPIHTEMKARLRASESAALASSIYMVCRKRSTSETAYYNEIKPAIQQCIHQKLDQFWAEGISGSDFFISAIGPAVEVFGKYASVEKLSGEKVTVKELLEYVRQVVSEHALNRILKNTQLGGIDNTTRFYLIWRFTYGNTKVLFDDASKLSRAIGFDLEANWDSAGLVKKDKQFISIKGPVERRNDETFQGRIAKHFPDILQETLFDDEIITTEAPSMIDILQQCLIFWGRNDRLTIVKLLEGSGYRSNNHFWEVAQSISDVLPDGDKEKQLLQGFLYGKEGYQSGQVPIDDITDTQENLFGEEA